VRVNVSALIVGPRLARIHSQVVQEALRRVDLAFQHFFRRVREGQIPNPQDHRQAESELKTAQRRVSRLSLIEMIIAGSTSKKEKDG
jgi:hypothetical protein